LTGATGVTGATGPDLTTVDTVGTSDNTVTTISTIPVPDDTVIVITAWVAARRTDDADRGGYQRQAVVYRENGGNATRQGNTQTLLTRESRAAYQVFINVSGTDALIQVRGINGHSINWKCRYFTTEVS
jgi:hypothetical protein